MTGPKQRRATVRHPSTTGTSDRKREQGHNDDDRYGSRPMMRQLPVNGLTRMMSEWVERILTTTLPIEEDESNQGAYYKRWLTGEKEDIVAITKNPAPRESRRQDLVLSETSIRTWYSTCYYVSLLHYCMYQDRVPLFPRKWNSREI